MEKPKLPLHRVQVGFHQKGFMRQVTIHNQKDGSFPTVHQPLEKLYEHRSPYSPWGDRESKLSPGANRRNHIQGKLLTCLANHRGLTDGCRS